MLSSKELAALDQSQRFTLVRKAVSISLTMLLDRDMDLLASGGHEQVICHRLAVYLEKFTDLNVDCEYNRNMGRPKELATGKRFRPDIIIHRRLSNEENILVIETKVRSHRQASDIEKIQELINEQGAYRYSVDAFIDFKNDPHVVLRKKAVRICAQWMVDGAAVHDDFARVVEPEFLDRLSRILPRRTFQPHRRA